MALLFIDGFDHYDPQALDPFGDPWLARGKAALQPGDGIAHRRRGHPELLRRAAKTAAPHHGHHHFQLCQT